MYQGIIAFGFNSNGYGEYDNGMVVDIVSYHTKDVNDTLELVRIIARDYCKDEVKHGWDMPYDWNWGDVFNEVPSELFEAHGITCNTMSFNAMYPIDEIAVKQMFDE